MSRGGSVRPDADDPATAQRLRERRKELGITQEALAGTVGVTRQTIIATESGDYAPSVYLALRIAGALESTVEELWGTGAAPDGRERFARQS